ncbi:hypothetical protein GCK32_011483 [Trichostrongylus colubriformis]|uniref:Uncharacterized protein n=1 Tax=Trichostrongylus colubriformis TaxID=6319 RepID=A0AAN8G902_TRICO
MDVFKVIVEAVLSVSIAIAVPCSKAKHPKQPRTRPTRGGLGSRSLSKSLSEATSPKPAARSRPPAAEKPDVELKLLPAQLREIIEAEQMAKACRGYDSYDVQGDEAKK